jgi:putative endonuclease
MRINKNYQVYIATNYPRCTVLYTGITNNIFSRDNQHQSKINRNSFTARYNVNRIVYYETYDDIKAAIGREKQIKSWPRRRKIELIESINPEWKDMIDESLR